MLARQSRLLHGLVFGHEAIDSLLLLTFNDDRFLTRDLFIHISVQHTDFSLLLVGVFFFA